MRIDSKYRRENDEYRETTNNNYQSNGQEQSDSYQNSIFENVSEQQEKLFCRVTSSDNQPKNQQPNVEAIPQQEMQYQECNENMQDPYLSSVSPNVMPQQGHIMCRLIKQGRHR